MGIRKITVMIPDELIEEATKNTGKNITDTIKEGLQLIRAKNAYQGLLGRKGKEKIKLNVKRLRGDQKE